MLRVLSLFAGIGGFDLGMERTGGFKTVAFCEIDPYCRRVLAKHWPEVPCYDDVRTLTADRLAADGIAVDVICGGFPCQNVSNAAAVWGGHTGLDGAQSGLWSEYARLISELRPRYIVVENVAALLVRGLDVVLGDLAALGYDAEWHCIPAAHFGAPQNRDRVWVAAYTPQERDARLLESLYSCADGPRWPGGKADLQLLADAPFEPGNSHPQPLIRRVDGGFSDRVDRVGACGNAVDPLIPELIGGAILQSREAA